MDHFLGYFLPRLAERVPECATLIEAITEGYKICHPDRLDGYIERTSEFNQSDDGLYFQRPQDVCLSGRACVPSLLNHPLRYSSRIATPSHIHDSDANNIVIESRGGKSKIKSLDSAAVCGRIKTILNQISNGNLSDATKEHIYPVINCTINDASLAWFNLLAWAVDNEAARTEAGKFYRNIVCGNHTVELRISDHYTVIARKFNGKALKNSHAQQHVSLNLFDKAKTQMLSRNKTFIGDGQPGAQFDGDDTRIGIVEITFNMLELSYTPTDGRTSDIVAILKSLARLVELDDASPSKIKSVMSNEPSLAGKFTVDTNIIHDTPDIQIQPEEN